MVVLRVGFGGGVGRTGAVAGGDAVTDGDHLGPDEDVFDEQAQHVLTLLDAGDVRTPDMVRKFVQGDRVV